MNWPWIDQIRHCKFQMGLAAKTGPQDSGAEKFGWGLRRLRKGLWSVEVLMGPLRSTGHWEAGLGPGRLGWCLRKL